MVVGFNHNFKYKGVVYHVQTEDSGIKNPHFITLLYREGTILASKKTSYADIIKVDNLEQVVEDMMKEQHQGMLRRLKNGEFDHLLGLAEAPPPPTAAAAPAAVIPPPAVPPRPAPAASVAPPSPVASVPAPPSPAPTAPRPAAPAPPPPAKLVERIESPMEASLDEIILSYMVGEDRKGGR